jgi:hypothetical protein
MKPNLERLDQLIAAAQAWREFQYPDSIDDQKSDRRLRGDALDARDRLLQEIDMLENEPSDRAADSARPCHFKAFGQVQCRKPEGHDGDHECTADSAEPATEPANLASLCQCAEPVQGSKMNYGCTIIKGWCIKCGKAIP